MSLDGDEALIWTPHSPSASPSAHPRAAPTSSAHSDAYTSSSPSPSSSFSFASSLLSSAAPSRAVPCPTAGAVVGDVMGGAGAGWGAPAAFESDSKFSAAELLCTRTVLLTGDDVEGKREELRRYFHLTFSLYERLFSLLSSDASYYEQPDALRHPLIFYFGHTAVFYVNKLMLAKLLQRRISPTIEATCAIGVDEMSWDDCNASHYTWPTVQQLRDYRDEVRLTVDRVISRMQLTLPISWSSPAWTILMGIEHERIHLETSSVLFRQLPLQRIRPSPTFALCPSRRLQASEVPANRLVPVPGGVVHLGKSSDDATYGWDNEYGELVVEVSGFSAAALLVSNAEFLSFVQAGGYDAREWWSAEGWKYKEYRQLSHPLFWVPPAPDGSGAGWRLRCIAEVVDMPWDWPVEINYLEAKAFCNWKAQHTGQAIRMPTEAEWLRMRDFAFPLSDEQPVRRINDQPYWEVAPGNVNLEHWTSSCPVDRFPFGASGLCDVIGNVWQHTETPISALPGFRTHPLYDDFSVPTFDGRHHLLMGGSFISTGNEACRSARYAFRTHFMQHAGFRYIHSQAALPPAADAVFTEPDPHISAIIHQHFAPAQPLNLPNYHQTLARTILHFLDQAHSSAPSPIPPPSSPPCVSALPLAPALRPLSLLEVGCGLGRVCFELAGSGRFHSVTGVDRTARIIRLASHLQGAGRGAVAAAGGAGLPYCLPTEGELQSYHEVSLEGSGLHLSDAALSSLHFVQADVNNLIDDRWRDVDVLLLNCTLEQLQRPTPFLLSLHSRIAAHGLLVVASTFQWDEEVTAKDDWLGGRRENGESIDSSQALHDALTPQFTALHHLDTDIARPTHVDRRRTLVHTVQVSVWRKR